ncbi:MAG TPA: SRPBCC domain-containing protein [Staphylococcus sp.]|nr:SRPBCC domain-containing protein [Staphylococcus sp.]
MQINVPKEEVFEAFVNPDQINGFWFSSSSERWESGKTITLRYEEYNAEIEIRIESIKENNLIKFTWGEQSVVIQFENEGQTTIVTTVEKDLEDTDTERLLAQKEGWVYMLSCLKAYIEHGVKIRGALL